LGVAVYTSVLIGHHVSAHRLVHHRAVATPDDPSSAPAGLGFWRYAPRAWRGSYRAGLLAESALRARGAQRGLHPYWVYSLGAVAALATGVVIAGPRGAVVWFCLAAYAQVQILLADYVQHYGLQRSKGPETNGKIRFEPVGPRHSWNAPQWFSSALMLNAPRHSDHHAHPSRPYPALRLDDDAPMLPWPLPVACVLALSPPHWRRAMRGPVAKWSARGARAACSNAFGASGGAVVRAWGAGPTQP
jgi:alkane 1-monooxygenase